MVSLARKNLLHDRTRFLITVSGVAFAVTLVLAVAVTVIEVALIVSVMIAVPTGKAALARDTVALVKALSEPDPHAALGDERLHLGAAQTGSLNELGHAELAEVDG